VSTRFFSQPRWAKAMVGREVGERVSRGTPLPGKSINLL
jgi:hypothetical protein